MGSILQCCCKNKYVSFIDSNFKSEICKLNTGGYKTTVTNKNGENINLFCDYSSLTYLNEMSKLNPDIADKVFYFIVSEVEKMNHFLIVKNIPIDRFKFYKVEIIGIDDEGLFSDPKKELKIIEFHLSGECDKNNRPTLMKYSYLWRKDGRLGLDNPKQTLEFTEINNEDKDK